MPRNMILALMLFCSSSLVMAAAYSPEELASVETSKEAQIRQLRTEEITQIRIALGRRIEKNRQADLYFRLAELYLEAYQTDFLREGRVHEKRLTQKIPDPKIDRSASLVHLRSGLKACEELVRLKIPFDRMDSVYYFLAYNHKELGNEKKSTEYFQTLISRYPNSVFMYEAVKEMGDTAFDKQDYRKAMGLYQRALALSIKGDTEARVRYRLAWTYYRTKQHSKAIEEMKTAVAKASNGGEKFISLKEEALRDMAVFLVETGNVDEAVAYFHSVLNDQTYFPKVLEKLGREYEHSAKPAKALQVYEAILKTHPESETAIRVTTQLMEIDIRKGRPLPALARLKVLQLPDSIPEDSQVSYSNLKALVRKTATENHEAFRKTGGGGALTVAHDYYSVYLNNFLKREDARKETNEIKMYLADAKRDLGQSLAASDLYKQVIQAKDPKYSKQAVDLWVGSLMEAMKDKKSTGNAPSALELDFIAAVDFLNENSTESETAREATLRAAQVLAGYPSQQPEALERIHKIIAKYPGSKQALIAAKLWLQMVADKKNTDELAALINKLKENSVLIKFDLAQKDRPLTTAMAQYEDLLKVSSIEKIEKSKDISTAASEYEKYAAETKDPKQAEKAYNNALLYYEKTANWDGVVRVATKLNNKVSLKRAAIQYFILGNDMKAAHAFRLVGENLAAARVAEASSQAAFAFQAFEEEFKTNPKAANHDAMLLDASRFAMRRGKERQAIQWLEQCKSMECLYELSELHLRMKSHDKARKAQKALAASKEDRSVFVTDARFEILKQQWESKSYPALKLPDAQLKKAVTARVKAIEDQAKAFQSIIQLGGPTSIEATLWLASQVVATARAIENTDLTLAKAAAKDNYKKSLAKASAPLRDKAKSMFKSVYAKMLEGNVYVPLVPAIADSVAQDSKEMWARVQGARPMMRLLGISPQAGTDALLDVRKKLAQSPTSAALWVDYGNLLWGFGKQDVARVAYQQAIEIEPKNVAAVNNLATFEVSGDLADRFQNVYLADSGFKKAIELDGSSSVPKFNRAALMNYYRLYKNALPFIDGARSKIQADDVEAAYLIAVAGSGNRAEAQKQLGKVSSKYAKKIVSAALSEGEDCLDALSGIDQASLKGLEIKGVEWMRKVCTSEKK